MARKRAQISEWAKGKGGKARCDACGREFTSPSQYRLVGDEVLCRAEKACIKRSEVAALNQVDQAQAQGITPSDFHYDPDYLDSELLARLTGHDPQ